MSEYEKKINESATWKGKMYTIAIKKNKLRKFP
jgi:hypothetical protein